MTGPLNSGDISTRLARIAELARMHPERVFKSLHHVIDVAWLREAYRRTRKSGAVGVDEQTAEQYAEHLEENLAGLLVRFRTGTYRAPPVRRAHIPKGDGRTRPIGVPTFEDKILQRAVAMVVEAIYEQDFHPGSYGFRPKRGAHDALGALREGLMPRGGWVLEVDIQSFFDTIDHGALRSILDERITDGVIRRAIDKWLRAGVMEQGAVAHPDLGTPQGGVISPLLANVYLHTVLDKWFESEVKPRLIGHAFLVRFADDFVLVFEQEDDARRVMDVLPKRFGKFGLTLHPEKTKLVKFTSPGRSSCSGGPSERPGSFDLLGFTHRWGLSRSGYWVVLKQTMHARFTRALGNIREWCRTHRHEPIAQQAKMLGAKVRGHLGYYAVVGNSVASARFVEEVRRTWYKWLSRRSNQGRISWNNYALLLARYPLPKPLVRRPV